MIYSTLSNMVIPCLITKTASSRGNFVLFLGQSSFFYEEDFALEAGRLFQNFHENEDSFENLSRDRLVQIISEHLKKNMRIVIIVQCKLHK
jgi:hypothetical protein